jgi:hypothetical protein
MNGGLAAELGFGMSASQSINLRKIAVEAPCSTVSIAF